jgi:flagellar motor component MotA
MPISENVYSVYLDGRPIQRGLTRHEAEKHADYFARNVCRLKASDKRRAPELEVRLDKQITKEEDELYKWAKTY